MNTQMTGKQLMRHHYQKKKIFMVIKTRKLLVMEATNMQKEFVKVLR